MGLVVRGTFECHIAYKTRVGAIGPTGSKPALRASPGSQQPPGKSVDTIKKMQVCLHAALQEGIPNAVCRAASEKGKGSPSRSWKTAMFAVAPWPVSRNCGRCTNCGQGTWQHLFSSRAQRGADVSLGLGGSQQPKRRPAPTCPAHPCREAAAWKPGALLQAAAAACSAA